MRNTSSNNMAIWIYLFNISAHLIMPIYDKFAINWIITITELYIIHFINKFPHCNRSTISPTSNNIT